jgi:hypothetical protein
MAIAGGAVLTLSVVLAGNRPRWPFQATLPSLDWRRSAKYHGSGPGVCRESIPGDPDLPSSGVQRCEIQELRATLKLQDNQ